MRVIAVSTLRSFWERYPDSEQELKAWNVKMRNANYQNANMVKKESPTADPVGNNKVVFNICRNKYRMLVLFRYNLQIVFIRFLGTHKEYDKILDIKNI